MTPGSVSQPPSLCGKKRKLTTTTATPLTLTSSSPAKQQSPVDYLLITFVELGVRVQGSREKDYFVKVTPKMIAAYDKSILRAVRERNLQDLQAWHEQGQTLQCCNRFGESLLHMACRNSSTELVKYLVLEANVSVYVRDDYGRTPLHDACWTVKPNFELMEFLLQQAPDLLALTDVRGHLPFAYVRKNHWSTWVDFLKQRKEQLRNCKRVPSHVPTAVTTSASEEEQDTKE